MKKERTSMQIIEMTIQSNWYSCLFPCTRKVQVSLEIERLPAMVVLRALMWTAKGLGWQLEGGRDPGDALVERKRWPHTFRYWKSFRCCLLRWRPLDRWRNVIEEWNWADWFCYKGCCGDSRDLLFSCINQPTQPHLINPKNLPN